MGRSHTPIDPGSPFADFASGLRHLKRTSSLTYRQMSRRARYCASVLSEAASGRRLPTLDVTLAYVRVCGGSESEWSARWDLFNGRGGLSG